MRAGISKGGRLDLDLVIRGMMADIHYMDDILDVYVTPYAGAIGPQFIPIYVNARPHRAKVVEVYLQQENIVRKNRPARASDFNAIEHVWNMLQVAILRCPV